MNEPDAKDRIGWLLRLYECECSDNSELYRRGSFILTIIIAVGTLSFTTLRLSRAVALWPAIGSAFFLLMFLFSTLLLVVAACCLARALFPTDWEYPEHSSFVSQSTDSIVEELSRCIAKDQDTNTARYGHLRNSLLAIAASVVILLFQAVTIPVIAPASATASQIAP